MWSNEGFPITTVNLMSVVCHDRDASPENLKYLTIFNSHGLENFSLHIKVDLGTTPVL